MVGSNMTHRCCREGHIGESPLLQQIREHLDPSASGRKALADRTIHGHPDHLAIDGGNGGDGIHHHAGSLGNLDPFLVETQGSLWQFKRTHPGHVFEGIHPHLGGLLG